MPEKELQWGSRCSLPRLESYTYIAGWTLTATYIFYCIYTDSAVFEGSLSEYDFEPGWIFHKRKRDISNYEWMFWSGWFIQAWPWLLLQALVSLITHAHQNLWQQREAVFLWTALFTLCNLLGPSSVALMVAHCVLIYATTYLRSKPLLWLVSLTLLSTLNFSPFVDGIKLLAGHDPYEQRFYLIMFTTAMVNLRYTSAGLEIIEDNATNSECKKGTGQEGGCVNRRPVEGDLSLDPVTMRRMLCYVFYLPLFFTGPLLTFNQFHSQFSSPCQSWTRANYWGLVKRLVRLVIWLLLTEFLLHFFYFNSMQHNLDVLNKVSRWTLAGVCLASGQFFMLKYLVFFGLPSIVASLDHITTPPGPVCIARVYLYSDMWKYFDRGLYNFLKRYIYIPIGGSREGFLRQMLASCSIFSFIYYWHGAESYLFLWCIINLMGIAMETGSRRLATWPPFHKMERTYLSAPTSRRVRALLGVPLMALSAGGNLFFLGGTAFGQVVFRRFILEGSLSSLCVLGVCLYCLIQTSMEINNWEKRSAQKKLS